jgi:hypothetical protein
MPRYTSLFDDLDVLRALAQAVETEVPTVRGQPIEYTDMLPAEYGKPDANDPTTPSPSRDPQRQEHLLMVKQLLTDLLAQAQDKPKVSDFSSLKDVIAFLQAHQITNAAGQPIVDTSGNVKDQAGLAAYIKQYAQTAEQAGGFVGNQMKAHMQTIIAELNQAPQLGEAAREFAEGTAPAQPQQNQSGQAATNQGGGEADNRGQVVDLQMPFSTSGGVFDIDDLRRWPRSFADALGNQGRSLSALLGHTKPQLDQQISMFQNAAGGTQIADGFNYGSSPSAAEIVREFSIAFDVPGGTLFRAAQAAQHAAGIVGTLISFFQAIPGVSALFYRQNKDEIDGQLTFLRNFYAALSGAQQNLQRQAGEAANLHARGW